MFFNKEENLKVLGDFLRKAELFSEGESKNKHLPTAIEIVRSIHKSPEEWDERCSRNIEWIGPRFIEMLRNFDKSKEEAVDDVFSSSYRFLCEFDFMIGVGRVKW